MENIRRNSTRAPGPWRSMLRRLCHAVVIACAWLAPLSAAAHDFRVLLFSKTTGFRHDSIPAGIAAIQQLGAENDFDVFATEDSTAFTAANLAQFDVVIFLNTTGNVLDVAQQTAFQQYIQSGKGWVGVHSASDTEQTWPWYGQLVGAYLRDHHAIQPGTVLALDRAHPSTSPLPERWVHTDEWYNFQTNPRGTVHVLATLDESTVVGGTMGHDHPIAWCREFDGGRTWYTAMGHTAGTYSEPEFRAHLLGGIRWAAGHTPGDAGGTVHSRYERIVLDDGVNDPMAVDVAPDGRVFFVERGGRLKAYSPITQSTAVVGVLPVFTGREDGLLGLALDPAFATNGWIYLYYSPDGITPENVLSRFTISGSALVAGSERVLLRVGTDRTDGAHSGGGMEFGPGGNLYLAIGDSTHPGASDGYAPIDERPGRAVWDAQKSSANTNTFTGKILRIHPESDGTYSIPSGNLFPPGTPLTRPEIFVMGCRNPFRIAVDPVTGAVFWGDIGPDAGDANPARGPYGYDELNLAQTPGNYGWPYLIADNKPYRDYDFATGISGTAFNPTALFNNSPNNTGALTLPPARGALLWYPYGAALDFPAIAGGSNRTAMAGAVYRHNPGLASDVAFPPYFDRTLFFMEWSRNRIYEVKTDTAGGLLKVVDFAPTIPLSRPMDLTFGPDGAMYLLEWGNGFLGNNPDAQLVKIVYNTTNKTPVARPSANVTSGAVPLTVTFSSAGSFDPDPGDVLTYEWDFDLNGTIDSTAPNPTHTYTTAGNYTAQLRVTDPDGKIGTASIDLWVGNSAPTITFTWPPDGAFFDWGDEVAWSLRADDPEDGSTITGGIAPADVLVEYLLGHATHAHGLGQTPGVSGAFVTENSHLFEDDIFFAISGTYVDRGAPGVNPATGRSAATLQPKVRQAEHYTDAQGITVSATGDPVGGRLDVASIDHGDHISFFPMNLLHIEQIGFRVAAAVSGGRIEIRADSPGGPLVGTAFVPGTGGAATYADVFAPISDPGGTRTLYFVFLRNPGDGDLFRVNWISFRGPGATQTARPPRISQVRARRPANLITIEFDEIMDAASLANAGHYALTGATILAIQPAADQRSVTLATSALAANQPYVLSVSGVRDLAGDFIAPATRIPFKTVNTVLAMNVGGPAYIGADGTSYLAEQYVSGGATYFTNSPIAGTIDDALYQTVRFGNFSYAIPIANGSYFVTLKLAEIYWSANNQRVFSVSAEGAPALEHVDIHALAGGFTAIDLTFPVTVTDGTLNLNFVTEVDNAMISGFVITDAAVPYSDFSSWQTFYFGSPAAPAAAATADSDGDGHDNASEFAFGGDPTLNDSASFAPVVTLTGTSGPKLTLTYRKGVTGLNYRAKWSDTLTTGSWSEAGVEAEAYFAPTDSYRRSVPILPGETRKFLRLEIGP